MSVQNIIEAYGQRVTIEQDFHDVKEVWGAGQQQVRKLASNIAAFHLNLWMQTLTELWAWSRSADELVDRRASPWDDPTRRPSQADRRKALRRACCPPDNFDNSQNQRQQTNIQQLLQDLIFNAA